MTTIQWIPKSDGDAHGEKAILCIYACAYGPTNVSANQSRGAPKTNHWVFFCAISQSSAIRIDPSPSGANNSVVLALNYKTYLVTNKAIKVVRLVTTDLTVNGLLNAITAAKYDKYQFTQSGQGCRYWVYCVIKLLQRNGILRTKEEVDTLEQAIQQVWDDKGNPAPAAEQTPAQQGRFYALT